MKIHADQIGCVLGSAIGGYLSWRYDSYWYAGIGAGTGIVLGDVVGWFYRNWRWRRRRRKTNKTGHV